jgi:TIGR03009 family protein
MLRFFRVCGLTLLIQLSSTLGFAQQQQGLTPEQQRAAAEQFERAQQVQQTLPQGENGAPILVMTAEQAIAAGAAQATKAPFDPLPADHVVYLDSVLKAWETRTARIDQYQCTLSRWQYDPSIDPTSPAVIDKGVLQYAKPDKGLFRIDERQALTKKGPNPEYRKSDKFGEYWVCDGEYIHIRDRNEMKALKVQLAPEQRHQGIHNSPLPFLFGVKAEEIKRRYWIRPVAPPAGSSDVWLEAWPKQLDDAGNYSRVQVVLDPQEKLPKALIVFLPNWEPQFPHREVYEFTDRKADWSLVDAMKQKLFMKDFIQTDLPSTWQVIVEPYVEPQEAGQPGQGRPTTQQRVAAPPAAQLPLR